MTNDRLTEPDIGAQTNYDVETGNGSKRRSLRRTLEPLAIAIMLLGFFMIFQPFTIVLYSYSYVVMLVGLVLFMVASHLPE